MKSRILIISLVLMCLTVRQAAAASSPVHFGTEGGLALSNLSGLDSTTIADSLSTRLGFAAGLFLSVELSKTFSILGEVLYTQKGSEAVDSGGNLTFNLSYVEVPVLLKLSLPLEVIKPYFFTGGAVNIKVLAESVQNGSTSPITDAKSTDIGIIAGIGVDIDKFFINARYELGMGDISDTTKVQNGTIMVMTGYSFI